MQIADLFEEKWVEETDDDDQIVLLRLIDPFVGNILYLFTLILTVCELHTFEDEIEGIVDEFFSLLSLFLNPSPDNSCEDLSQCCFYFPMTLAFFSNLLYFNLSNFMKSY